MNFPGTGPAGGGGFNPNDPNVKWVCPPYRPPRPHSLTSPLHQLTNAMESCYAKTAMSGVAGFGLGGLFGIFMASVRLPPFPPTQTQN